MPPDSNQFRNCDPCHRNSLYFYRNSHHQSHVWRSVLISLKLYLFIIVKLHYRIWCLWPLTMLFYSWGLRKSYPMETIHLCIHRNKKTPLQLIHSSMRRKKAEKGGAVSVLDAVRGEYDYWNIDCCLCVCVCVYIVKACNSEPRYCKEIYAEEVYCMLSHYVSTLGGDKVNMLTLI